jgi:uncharacterized membrane protein
LIKEFKETSHNRTQFQIDRIAFFSDAVIAIAITLMVLEIKIPEMGKEITFQQILKQYSESIILHTLALMIGFITIGNLWMRHHELFEHIINYNKSLTKFNLYFLFTVSLLPITISFLFTENEPLQLQKFCYFTNLLLVNFFYYLILVVIFKKKNNFSSVTDRNEIRKIKTSSLIDMLVLLMVLILSIINVSWFYVPFFIPGVIKAVSKRISKRKNSPKARAKI